MQATIYINSTKYTAVQRYVGWRCLHAEEGGYENPLGMPAVRPSIDANRPVEMTREIQWMSYDLNEGRITKQKWRALYGSTVAFTNNQSWYEKICRDYVNGFNLSALDEFGNPSLPKIMKGILMAGGFYRMRQDGAYLVAEPGVGAIDANKTIPSIEEIKSKNWCFRAVTSGPHVYNILGSTVPILVPYILNAPARYPIEWFEGWDRDYLPDPTVFYCNLP